MDDSQSTQHKHKRQRHFLHIRNLQPPQHINRQEQDAEVEHDIDNGEREIEIPQRHAPDRHRPIPPPLHRHAQKHRRDGFREPPQPDEGEEDVDDLPKGRGDEDATVHKEGGDFDGWGGGDVDFVKGVDGFEEEDLVGGGDGLDVSSSAV